MMAEASNIDNLLAEASAPDPSLSVFFESHLEQLYRIRVRDVPLPVLQDIASIIEGTKQSETDWMVFLNDLGIVENTDIINIKLKSKLREELPVYLALTGPLFETLTFGEVVKVLMENQRLDALLYIKRFLESFIEISGSHSYAEERPAAPEVEELDIVGDLGIRTETITILILHADSDNNVAEKLRVKLRKAGFVAKTLSNFANLLMMKPFEVFPALISAVDFIVPIVSVAFLRSIHSRSSRLMNAFDNVKPSHNSNNDYIYQLLLNQYVRNKCLNFNVRPVMVPHFNWNLLTDEVLLKQPFRLWEEVPDFIVMLNGTKQLLNRMAARGMNRF